MNHSKTWSAPHSQHLYSKQTAAKEKVSFLTDFFDISYGLLLSIISKKKTTLRSSLHVKIILHTRKAFPFIILYLLILINPPVPRIAAVNFAKNKAIRFSNNMDGYESLLLSGYILFIIQSDAPVLPSLTSYHPF